MKKNLILAVVMLCALLFAGCAGAEKKRSDKDILTTEDWINVNDGDVYAFFVDGTGMHERVSLKYSYDPGQHVLTVTEGVAALGTKEYVLDTDGEYVRLVALDKLSFYVRASDYPTIAETVRKQNEGILTERRWTISTTDSGGQLVSDFYKDGTGHIWLYKNLNLLMDTDTTWEMIDNNTVKVHWNYEKSKYQYVLDITNDNGDYRLLTPGKDDLFHVPVQ